MQYYLAPLVMLLNCIGNIDNNKYHMLLEEASAAVSERRQMDIVCGDLSKVFDVVSQTALPETLLLSGVGTLYAALVGNST